MCKKANLYITTSDFISTRYDSQALFWHGRFHCSYLPRHHDYLDIIVGKVQHMRQRVSVNQQLMMLQELFIVQGVYDIT